MSGLDWVGDAACRLYHDWTPSERPQIDVEARMAHTCGRCPVLTACASHALATRAEGGYYAGTWIPNRVSCGRVGVGWVRARDQLRELTKENA